MSRMTKFLKQTCVFEAALRDSFGKPILDKFGEPSYAAPIKLKCRRERNTKDVLTTTGSIKRSDTVLYTDESHEIQTDDKLDGRVVLVVAEYTNEAGKVEGYESHA